MKKYILMATNEFLYDRFVLEFSRYENVLIHYGVFETLKDIDCVVTAGNSFGIMDGGIDLAMMNYFGESIQEKVQSAIINEYFGEQPIGTSLIVETNDDRIPYLAYTPTMTVPTNIKNTNNVYHAMRATLMQIEKHPKIKVAAIPAFGHGSGGVHASDVAYQMAKAYLQIISMKDKLDWDYANRIYYAVNK